MNSGEEPPKKKRRRRPPTGKPPGRPRKFNRLLLPLHDYVRDNPRVSVRAACQEILHRDSSNHPPSAVDTLRRLYAREVAAGNLTPDGPSSAFAADIEAVNQKRIKTASDLDQLLRRIGREYGIERFNPDNLHDTYGSWTNCRDRAYKILEEDLAKARKRGGDWKKLWAELGLKAKYDDHKLAEKMVNMFSRAATLLRELDKLING